MLIISAFSCMTNCIYLIQLIIIGPWFCVGLHFNRESLAEACSDGDVNAVKCSTGDEGRSVNEHTEREACCVWLVS